MSETINKSTIEHVADLIKVRLKDEEVNDYVEMLDRALNPASDLSELNTKETPILSHPTGLTTSGTADEVRPSLGSSKALKNAKKNGRESFGYIKVPKVLNT